MPPDLSVLGGSTATVSGRPDRLAGLAAVVAEVGDTLLRRGLALDDALVAFGPTAGSDVATRLSSVASAMAAAATAVDDFARALRLVDTGTVVGDSGLVVTRQYAVDRILADLTRQEWVIGRLPNGRRYSLAALEALGASARMAWLDAFIAATGDPTHRAIAGILAFLADADLIAGDDPSRFSSTWWSVADAAVLLVLQDGWLAARGVAPPPPPDGHADTYLAAVDAWAAYTRAVEAGVDGEERLVAWVAAEELGVIHAEAVVAHRWTDHDDFVAPTAEEWDQIADLAPGTHAFRLAIMADTERDLLWELVRDAVAHVATDVIDPRLVLPGGPAVVVASETVGGLVDTVGDLAGWVGDRGLGPLSAVAGIAVGGVGVGARVVSDAVATGATRVTEEIVDAGIDVTQVLLPDDWEEALAEALVDPTLVPPHGLRVALDVVLGTDRADAGLSFTYYFPMLIERGLLPPIPRQHVDADGEVHTRPRPRPSGPLRD